MSAGGQFREAMFYSSELIKRLPAGIYPLSYYSHGSSDLGEYVMLLQDCTANTAEPVTPMNFVFGNQVWGLPKPVIPARDPIDVLHAVFRRAASQHRMFWRDSALLKQVCGVLGSHTFSLHPAVVCMESRFTKLLRRDRIWKALDLFDRRTVFVCYRSHG